MKVVQQQWAVTSDGRHVFQIVGTDGVNALAASIECLLPQDYDLRLECEATATTMLADELRRRNP